MECLEEECSCFFSVLKHPGHKKYLYTEFSSEKNYKDSSDPIISFVFLTKTSL